MAKATLFPVQFHDSTIFVIIPKGEPYSHEIIVEDLSLA